MHSQHQQQQQHQHQPQLYERNGRSAALPPAAAAAAASSHTATAAATFQQQQSAAQQQPQQQQTAGGEPFIIKTLDVHEQIGSGGPLMLWKIYRAFTKKDAREVSVWIHDKASSERTYKKRAHEVFDILKRGVRELDRLSANSSKTLLPLSLVEETVDALLFVTEPVIGSLANFLGDRVAMPAASIDDCIPDEQRLVDLDLRYGLFQVVEALNALHNTEHMLHCNITPRCIFLTRNAQWKLGGFEFATKRISVDGKYAVAKRPPSKHAEAIVPDLDYAAPETVLTSSSSGGGEHCTAAADMYSLGMTMCAFYNHGQSLIDSQQLQQQFSERAYKNELNKLMSDRIGNFLVQVPIALQQALEALLKPESQERPTAHQLLLLRCFQDEELRILRQLERDNYAQLSTKDRAKFLVHTLSRNLHLLPRKMWYSNVITVLQSDIQRPELASFAVEPLAYMLSKVAVVTSTASASSAVSVVADNSNDDHQRQQEYRTFFQHWLEPIFRSARQSLDQRLVVLRILPKTFSFIIDNHSDGDGENTNSDDLCTSLSTLVLESLEHSEFRVRLAALEASPVLLLATNHHHHHNQHNFQTNNHHNSRQHRNSGAGAGGESAAIDAATLLQLVERTLNYNNNNNQFNFPENNSSLQHAPISTFGGSTAGGSGYDDEQLKLTKAFLQLMPRFIERMNETACTTQLIPLLVRTINGTGGSTGKRGDALCGSLVQCIEKLVNEREHLLTPRLLAELLIPALFPWLMCEALQRPAFIKLAILLDAMNERVLQSRKEHFGIDDDELPLAMSGGGGANAAAQSASPSSSPRSTTMQSPSTASNSTTMSSSFSITGGGGGGYHHPSSSSQQQHVYQTQLSNQSTVSSMYNQQHLHQQMPAERKYSVPERVANSSSNSGASPPPSTRLMATTPTSMSQHRYSITPSGSSAAAAAAAGGGGGGGGQQTPQWSPVSRKFIQRLNNGHATPIGPGTAPQLIVSHAGCSPGASPTSAAQRRRMSKSALYSPPRRFSKQDSAPFLNVANLLAVAGMQTKNQKNYSAPGTPQRRESILESGAKNALSLLGVSSGSNSANRRHSITRLGLGSDSSLSQRRHSAVNIQSITSGVTSLFTGR